MIELSSRSVYAFLVDHEVGESGLHRILSRLSTCSQKVDDFINNVLLGVDIRGLKHLGHDVAVVAQVALDLARLALLNVAQNDAPEAARIEIRDFCIFCQGEVFASGFVEHVPDRVKKSLDSRQQRLLPACFICVTQ